MRPFTKHRGVAVPLLRSNVDTDAIIPSVEMTRVTKKGLSGGLFSRWRYLDRAARTPNANFILNQDEFAQASILLSGENFGCGSSREHAVWALAEFGFRVIIAPSFGSIFHTNCIANGVLPIEIPWSVVQQIAHDVLSETSDHQLTVDLEQRVISTPGDAQHDFEILHSDANRLINGWDAIVLTLQAEDLIVQFENRDQKLRPWVYLPGPTKREAD
jgi:3-isopropylmalate/(R)-2-methylmalate dehydratase small subunit